MTPWAPGLYLNRGFEKIGGEGIIFTTKWLKLKLNTAKYSFFGGEYRHLATLKVSDLGAGTV